MFFFCFFFAQAASSTLNEWPFSTKKVEEAVFQISNLSRQPRPTTTNGGTGFAIEREGKLYIVTTLDKVRRTFNLERNESDTSIQSKSRRVIKTEGLAHWSFPSNLALVKLPDHYNGPILKLADFNMEERIYILGFQNGHLRKMEAHKLQTAGPGLTIGVRDLTSRPSVSPGSPVFNNKGEVVGVLKWGTGDHHIWFTPSQDILPLFQTGDRPQLRNLSLDISKSISSAIEMAKTGDTEVQFALASELHQDYWQTKDLIFIQMAFEWYKAAAQNGHLLAQIQYGRIHMIGEGVLPDLNKSQESFEMAVKQGSLHADFFMGLNLLFKSTKEGTVEDFKEGWKILTRLASEGYRPARERIEKIQNRRFPPAAEPLTNFCEAAMENQKNRPLGK